MPRHLTIDLTTLRPLDEENLRTLLRVLEIPFDEAAHQGGNEKMTANDKRLLCILRTIRYDVERGAYCDFGICHALRALTCGQPDAALLRNRLVRLFRRWPAHSGSDAYPVPAADPRLAFGDAIRRGAMWDSSTRYGRSRRELLDFCITELEKLQ